MIKTTTNLRKIKTGREIDVSELEGMRQPGYRRINKGLNWDAGPVEKAKYELCEKILGYQQDNNLSDKEIAQKIHLTTGETRDILYCHIDYFTLDRLITYASRLFSTSEVEPKKIGKNT